MKPPSDYKHKNSQKRLCVFDTETDPFYLCRTPKPFTCGFKDLTTGDYNDFWGDDCIEQFMEWLKVTYADIPCLIYCHNFGGFDAHFMMRHISPGTYPKIINARISQVMLGGQEFRDSYRIIPVALSVASSGAELEKLDFDYDKMERGARDKHRQEIEFYQQRDCDALGDLVLRFHGLFGDRPTIGNTSINYLQQFHSFERLTPKVDATLRPYFFGGRNQCFETGVRRGQFKVYDVHSMYPAAMRNTLHPVGAERIVGRKIVSKTAFVLWQGYNDGAVPVRGADGSLDFTVPFGRFYSTIHEFNAGIDTGTIRKPKIIKTIGFTEWAKFDAFIDYCYSMRLDADARGDALDKLFWKFVMNSAYGKFAQDPSDYEEYRYSLGDEGIPEKDENGLSVFQPRFIHDDLIIWARPSINRFSGFFNVATGASITGAARSVLLRGLAGATRAVYCDTDSIFCERLDGVEIHPSKLGTWDLEAEGELFACAGKKLYALFTCDPAKRLDKKGRPRERVVYQGQEFWCVKKASKGSVLHSWEILKVAMGGVVRYQSDRPNFKLDGTASFITRDIRSTGKTLVAH